MSTSRRSTSTLVVACLLAAACGLPADDDARGLGTDSVPNQALIRDRPDVPAGTHRVVMFFVREGALVPVARRIRDTPAPAAALKALAAGPTETERANGLASVLPPAPDATVVREDAGVVTVDLPRAVEASSRSDAVLGYGQIVLTLTALPTITGVRFEQDGKVLQVPGADGALSERPLGRVDYRELIDAA